MIRVKRAYEPASRGDGRRVLVERLWPRGLTKEALALAEWCKDVAPSAELRTWFGHRPERWAEFERRYRAELDAHREAWAPLLEDAKQGTVTLVYGARDEAHNSAVALRGYLEREGARPTASAARRRTQRARVARETRADVESAGASPKRKAAKRARRG